MFHREKQDEYSMTVYASNNPILEHAAAILNSIDNSTESQDVSVTTIKIRVLDENDNEPKFEQKVYYAGEYGLYWRRKKYGLPKTI